MKGDTLHQYDYGTMLRPTLRADTSSAFVLQNIIGRVVVSHLEFSGRSRAAGQEPHTMNYSHDLTAE